jgi:hypothetical protein
MNKETEEGMQLLKQVRHNFARSQGWIDWASYIIGHHGNMTNQNEIKIFEFYHSERNKIEALTDEEIVNVFNNNSDCYADTRVDHGDSVEEGEVIQAMTIEAFKKSIKLLTGI